MRRAKIVATLGPATDSGEAVGALVEAGLDVARINMSHGTSAEAGNRIERVRQAARAAARPVAVLLDLGGPKIRTGSLRGGRALLREGSTVRITANPVEGDETCFSSNYPQLAREVAPGARILIDDGAIELRALGGDDGDLRAEVVHGGALGEHKGINLPGARLSLPSLTNKDVEDLRFGIAAGVDLVALSFVRSAADVRGARTRIRRLGGRVRLIAKIEKPEAIDDLARIIDAADGVMVARGDLAVETSPELVPVLQKRIIRDARRSAKSVITATQMLQSMIENPQPTRAEASDVANAILDGSDALMLSGETAVGRYPVEAVRMMDRIIRSAEAMAAQDGLVSQARDLCGPAPGRQAGAYGRAIAEAAVFAADEIDCRLIVVLTQSGHLARFIAALRPRQRIIALTPEPATYPQLALLWGVEPYLVEDFARAADLLLATGDRLLVEKGLAEPGERVVIMAGEIRGPAISNSMKLHTVGDFARPGGA